MPKEKEKEEKLFDEIYCVTLNGTNIKNLPKGSRITPWVRQMKAGYGKIGHAKSAILNAQAYTGYADKDIQETLRQLKITKYIPFEQVDWTPT